jgi:hypothetical protein
MPALESSMTPEDAGDALAAEEEDAELGTDAEAMRIEDAFVCEDRAVEAELPDVVARMTTALVESTASVALPTCVATAFAVAIDADFEPAPTSEPKLDDSTENVSAETDAALFEVAATSPSAVEMELDMTLSATAIGVPVARPTTASCAFVADGAAEATAGSTRLLAELISIRTSKARPAGLC